MSILNAVKAKLEGVSATVMAPVFSHDRLMASLATKRVAAEARKSEAEAEHRKAALDVEKGVPGAISRKAEAAGAVREADEELRDIMGAMIEVEAESREAAIRARHARDEAKESELRKLGAEREEVAKGYASLLKQVADTHARLSDLDAKANGMASGLGLRVPGRQLRTLAGLEIARVSRDLPGTNAIDMAAGHEPRDTSVRHGLRPMVEIYQSDISHLNKQLEARAAKRRKELRS